MDGFWKVLVFLLDLLQERNGNTCMAEVLLVNPDILICDFQQLELPAPRLHLLPARLTLLWCSP